MPRRFAQIPLYSDAVLLGLLGCLALKVQGCFALKVPAALLIKLQGLSGLGF